MWYEGALAQDFVHMKSPGSLGTVEQGPLFKKVAKFQTYSQVLLVVEPYGISCVYRRNRL